MNRQRQAALASQGISPAMGVGHSPGGSSQCFSLLCVTKAVPAGPAAYESGTQAPTYVGGKPHCEAPGGPQGEGGTPEVGGPQGEGGTPGGRGTPGGPQGGGSDDRPALHPPDGRVVFGGVALTS
jgi:hypothetical protein